MSDRSEERSSLAARLTRLFEEIRPGEGPQADRRRYTNAEVAKAISDKHPEISCSAAYLSALRLGSRDNPSDELRDALCDLFGVPRTYLAKRPNPAKVGKSAEQMQAEIQLAKVARNLGVRHLAYRALELTPEGLAAVTSIVEAVLKDQGRFTGRPKDTQRPTTT